MCVRNDIYSFSSVPVNTSFPYAVCHNISEFRSYNVSQRDGYIHVVLIHHGRRCADVTHLFAILAVCRDMTTVI